MKYCVGRLKIGDLRWRERELFYSEIEEEVVEYRVRFRENINSGMIENKLDAQVNRNSMG